MRVKSTAARPLTSLLCDEVYTTHLSHLLNKLSISKHLLPDSFNTNELLGSLVFGRSSICSECWSVLTVPEMVDEVVTWTVELVVIPPQLLHLEELFAEEQVINLIAIATLCDHATSTEVEAGRVEEALKWTPELCGMFVCNRPRLEARQTVLLIEVF